MSETFAVEKKPCTSPPLRAAVPVAAKKRENQPRKGSVCLPYYNNKEDKNGVLQCQREVGNGNIVVR